MLAVRRAGYGASQGGLSYSEGGCGRMGDPGEIAEMVVWLCSDRASYVTGAAYNVDGGAV